MYTRLIAATALSFALAAPVALAQDTIVIPDTVTTYVTEQPVDDAMVDVDVSVGTTLPDTVVVKEIPDNDDYAYAVVNKKRVIVEPSTKKVIKIIE